MVAAQVMKCLWVASLAVAAPQLDFGAQRTVLTVASAGPNNQQQIVSSVVSTLQPAIAKAVADALRASTTQSVSSTRGLTRSKATNKASLNNYVEEENYGPAQYNYEYKVADKQEQTFITQSEQRDGDAVTGKYSYVDPNGDLITVNYEAGPMGYTAFTDTKKGFVDVKERKASTKAKTKSTGFTKATGATKGVSSSFSSTSSSVNQADLISRIISSLQPQIKSAVSSALSSGSRTRTTTTFKETPRISAGSNGLEGTFGLGGNSVSIATPEFEIAY